MQYKGLAMMHPEFRQDLTSLKVSWYYTWGTSQDLLNDSSYIPMSRDGSIVNLPNNYSGFLLVFNEPNNPEPYGCNITPIVAIERYRILGNKFPKAKMVVGGISCWDSAYSGDWLKTFCSLLKTQKLPKPYALAVHGYRESWITVSDIKSWWVKQQKIVGTKVWITEMGDTEGNVANLKSLIDWIKKQSWIERYAVFTNRSNHEAWSIGDGVNLIDWNTGKLTAIGEYYASIK